MEPFYFHTKLDQTILLGIKAKNVQGLLEGIRQVPESSIYHHTHRFLQQHHYLSPEPPNDFSYWVAEVLGDDALGEQMSSIDIIQFGDIEEIRQAFITILETYLDSVERLAFAPTGEEFHFMSSRLFVLPTANVAHDIPEFQEILSRISVNVLYYHIFDARLRLERGANDFSRWFSGMGMNELAAGLERLDPYAYTLEGLRKRILVMVKAHGTH